VGKADTKLLGGKEINALSDAAADLKQASVKAIAAKLMAKQRVAEEKIARAKDAHEKAKQAIASKEVIDKAKKALADGSANAKMATKDEGESDAAEKAKAELAEAKAEWAEKAKLAKEAKMKAKLAGAVPNLRAWGTHPWRNSWSSVGDSGCFAPPLPHCQRYAETPLRHTADMGLPHLLGNFGGRRYRFLRVGMALPWTLC